MLIVAGVNLRNLEPRVWDSASPYYLSSLRAVMVSYGDFHQSPAQIKSVEKVGLREYLGVPETTAIFLDNGAFYFLRTGVQAERRRYTHFVAKTKPDWYPIAFDVIPTPKMTSAKQRTCFDLTMSANRAYSRDGFVPVIHVGEFLEEYLTAIQRSPTLLVKRRIALGAMVPNLLRAPKALAYEKILQNMTRVRSTFEDKSLHVFGIGGTATIHLAALLGVDSADSSGWRNRAARGIIQLPGSGDRMVANLGKWRGRIPDKSEWKKLANCRCPGCQKNGLAGLKADGLVGFCNRATHNLWVLLKEAEWVEKHLKAGTYARNFQKRLNNSTYLPLIKSVLKERQQEG